MKIRRVAVDARDAVDERLPGFIVVAEIARVVVRIIQNDARVRVLIPRQGAVEAHLLVGLVDVDAAQQRSLVLHLHRGEREELGVAVFIGMVVDRRAVNPLDVLPVQTYNVLVGARVHVQLLNDVVASILIDLDRRRLRVAVPDAELLVVPAELGRGAVLGSHRNGERQYG